MKTIFTLLVVVISLGNYTTLYAQETASSELNSREYKKRSAVYDYSEVNLNNTDTIPGFGSISEKLKISGTIYESDGVTPAKDVILYICQPDDYGDYNTKRVNGKRIVTHRGWVKTDANGHYTFYTFVPGTYWPGRAIQQIHGTIKEPNSSKEYRINHFVFDTDPLLRKSCRKKIQQKGLNNILTLEKKDGILVGQRDIVLQQNAPSS